MAALATAAALPSAPMNLLPLKSHKACFGLQGGAAQENWVQVNGGDRSAASAASRSVGSTASNCSRSPVAGCTNPSVCACSAGRPSCRTAAWAAADRAGLPAPTMLPAAAREL